MKLLLVSDPILRQVCSPVLPEELNYIKSLIPEMIGILNKEEGLALAANQVGITKRFFIKKVDDKVELVINPEIIEKGPPQKFNEGCLSIPGVRAETKRSLQVKARYRDESFNECEVSLSGIEAVAFQHEIDHLDGKLYIDQLAPMQRLLVMDRYRNANKLRGKSK